MPAQEWRQRFHRLVSSHHFEVVITGVILLNMLQMALLYENMTPKYEAVLDYCNLFFTVAFVLEAVLKITGYGLSYFSDSWNRFDFFVVCASVFDLVLAFANGDGGGQAGKFSSVGPQIAKLMRVLRVTRVTKLLK